MIRLSLVEQAPPVKSNGIVDVVSKVNFSHLRVRTCLGKSLPQRSGINYHSYRTKQYLNNTLILINYKL